MVEDVTIKRHDIGIATFVIRVTVLAIGGRSVGAQTMKSTLLLAINPNCLVAIHAQFRLRRLLIGRMTVFALFFIFRVPLDQRPWHDQPIKQALGICLQQGKADGHDGGQGKNGSVLQEDVSGQ